MQLRRLQRHFFRILPLLFLAAAVILHATRHDVPAAGTELPETLVMGVYAHVRSTEMYRKMEPVRSHIEQALNEKGLDVRVELRIYPTYIDAIKALATGEPDFVRYGPVSYVLARRMNPGLRLLAMESNQGSKTFSGVLAVPEDSPIQSIEQLRGKRLAFGDRNSTTGRYLSQAALVAAGIDAGELGEFVYLGRHDKVAFAVAAKNYDVGAMNENTFNKYHVAKELRKIATFPCVTKPWVAREGLPPVVFAALQSVLLEIDDPEVLKTIKRSGFLPATDEDYDLIRESMRLARRFDEIRVTFGLYSSQKPSTLYDMHRPLLDELQQRLQVDGWLVDFPIRVFPDYQQAIDAVISGEIDMARLGPASYVRAREARADIHLLGREDGGEQAIEGYFVVPFMSPVNSLDDLAGMRFAFGDRLSTSGSYLAKAMLLDAGITAGDLKSYSYLGRHDKVLHAVAVGKYDAGAIRSEIYHKLQAGRFVRIIRRFPIVDKAWVARAGLDKDLLEMLEASLLSLERPVVQRSLGRKGFAAASDTDYDKVREGIALSRQFETPE